MVSSIVGGTVKQRISLEKPTLVPRLGEETKSNGGMTRYPAGYYSAGRAKFLSFERSRFGRSSAGQSRFQGLASAPQKTAKGEDDP
jgi:hypothetical protein